MTRITEMMSSLTLLDLLMIRCSVAENAVHMTTTTFDSLASKLLVSRMHSL